MMNVPNCMRMHVLLVCLSLKKDSAVQPMSISHAPIKPYFFLEKILQKLLGRGKAVNSAQVRVHMQVVVELAMRDAQST